MNLFQAIASKVICATKKVKPQYEQATVKKNTKKKLLTYMKASPLAHENPHQLLDRNFQ